MYLRSLFKGRSRIRRDFERFFTDLIAYLHGINKSFSKLLGHANAAFGPTNSR